MGKTNFQLIALLEDITEGQTSDNQEINGETIVKRLLMTTEYIYL